uniref:Uncharacterized protein n=1 Tax=Rhizophora mucronata TaxID=61149 RepID=A0A2P2JQI4_RHIMU
MLAPLAISFLYFLFNASIICLHCASVLSFFEDSDTFSATSTQSSDRRLFLPNCKNLSPHTSKRTNFSCSFQSSCDSLAAVLGANS